MGNTISRMLDANNVGSVIDQAIGNSDIFSFFSSQASPIPLLVSISLALLGAGIVFRLVKGRDNLFNQIISCIFFISTIYCCAVLLYSFTSEELQSYLSGMPFISFRQEIVIVDSFYDNTISSISLNIILFTVLCLLARLSDWLLCHGKKAYIWLPCRLLSIIATTSVFVILNFLAEVFFPGMAAQYASFILLVILGAAILVGLFNPLLCIIFTVVNPVFGLLYTFFFSSFVGKLITSSVISSIIMCFLLYLFERLGYNIWSISESTLLWWGLAAVILIFCSYGFDTRIRK